MAAMAMGSMEEEEAQTGHHSVVPWAAAAAVAVVGQIWTTLTFTFQTRWLLAYSFLPVVLHEVLMLVVALALRWLSPLSGGAREDRSEIHASTCK